MQVKSNAVIRGALGVVASPEDHIDDPSLFTAAWGAMLAARGKGFDPSRLQSRHLIDRPAPAPEPIDQTLDRVGQKVRDIAEAKGYPRRNCHAA